MATKNNKIDSKNIYSNKIYLNTNSNWHQEDSPFKVSVVKKMMNKNNIKFNTCADVGCGAGLITELLSNVYPNISFVGFDLSKDVYLFWEERSKKKNLKFINGDVFDFDRSFDLILCLDVFEHVEDYFRFLKKLKKSGRKFIFNIPLDMNVVKVITNGIKLARTEVGHLHYFNQYTALETLKDCGFKVIDSFLSTAFLSVPPRNVRQLALLPLRLFTLIFGKSFAARIFGGQSLVVYAEINNDI